LAYPTLLELEQIAANTKEPRLTRTLEIAPGGVDPLGLRQINFDLMDLVLPSLNNVAQHIRPFTVVAWGWRQAAKCAQKAGKVKIDLSELRDFVDRIEVIYAWSQLLRNSNADLPGRDFLAFLLKADHYCFGGDAWNVIRAKRKDSTALSAPVNYGPVLKSLGWLEPSNEARGAYRHTGMVVEALNALDLRLGDRIAHPAFSRLGEVTISRKDVKEWGDAWALDEPSSEEQSAMVEAMLGKMARKELREGCVLIAEVVSRRRGDLDIHGVRRDMCGTLGLFESTPHLQLVAERWRAVQARQLFRFALESLLHWTLLRISYRPVSTAKLADYFIEETGGATCLRDWLSVSDSIATSLPENLDLLELSLSAPDLSRRIRTALAASLRDSSAEFITQREDRLPLSRAKRETGAYNDRPPIEFMTHVLGSWIFGQHVYWSVGRGLGDARSNGKSILRLKVVSDENGWTLAPGTNLRALPHPTPDRLETAMKLMQEAGLFHSQTAVQSSANRKGSASAPAQ
jgi:hypothetical protein